MLNAQIEKKEKTNTPRLSYRPDVNQYCACVVKPRLAGSINVFLALYFNVDDIGGQWHRRG